MPAEDAARLRADLKRRRESRGNDVVEIWPDHADAVRLFFRLGTQWHGTTIVVGSKAITMKTGLNYSAIPAIAGASGIVVDARVLDQLRTIEDAALAAMAKAP